MLGASARRGGRPVRVMHIITRLVRGGAQRVALALLRGLRREGFELVLVAGPQTGSEGSLWDEAYALGIPTIIVRSLVRQLAPLRDYRTVRELRAIVRSYRPDIVHAHTSKAGLLGCFAARREGVPAIVLAPHGHIFGDDAQIPGVPARGIKRRILAAACRRNTRYADVVVAPNDAERLDGIRRGIWSPDAVVTVPNGIDTGRFRKGDFAEARSRLGLPADAALVGVVARLTREKGLDLAIETIRLLPDVLLAIVGDGPERESLETFAESLDVADRTLFLGVRDDVDRILPAFDVCLVPSRSESHGLAAAEALACEVPVVASDVGGLRSLVLHGKTGLLVPVDDAVARARAVKRLLANRSLREHLGAAGRERVVARFSRDAMIARTVELYETLLERSAAETAAPAAPDPARAPA